MWQPRGFPGALIPAFQDFRPNPLDPPPTWERSLAQDLPPVASASEAAGSNHSCDPIQSSSNPGLRPPLSLFYAFLNSLFGAFLTIRCLMPNFKNKTVKKKKKAASMKRRIFTMFQVVCRALSYISRPHDKPLREVLSLFWLYRGGDRGSERLSSWPKVVPVVGSGAPLCPQAARLQGLQCSPRPESPPPPPPAPNS